MFKMYPQMTIDLNVIKENYLAIKNHVKKNVITSAVVKADAYGLGAKLVSDSLYDVGCRDFWVAYLKEALELRSVLPIDASIYVLQGFREEDIKLLRNYRIIPVINSLEEFNIAKGNSLELVLFVDTGLSRLGIRADDINEIIPCINKENIKYIISHLACAKDLYSPYNIIQKQRFDEVLNRIKRVKNIKAGISASGGVFLGDEFHYDIVRIGSFLYGIQASLSALKPKNVLSLRSIVLQKYILQAGDYIGYDLTFKVSHKMKVAIVSIGNADGIRRNLANKGRVLFYNKEGKYYKAPVVGSISMDLMACDVTSIPDELTIPNSEAILLDNNYSINDMAVEANTIPSEILINMNHKRINIIYNN